MTTYAHLNNSFHQVYTETGRLIIYRKLLSDDIVSGLRELLRGCAQDDYASGELQSGLCELYFRLIKAAERSGLPGHPWQNHLLYLIAADENPFSLRAEKEGSSLPADLKKAAAHDLGILKRLFGLDLGVLAQTCGLVDMPLPDNPERIDYPTGTREHLEKLKDAFSGPAPPAELADSAAEFYRTAGCGQMAFYAAFRWEPGTGLTGIRHPDPITLDDLFGYQRQKRVVIENTEAFLKGRPANNLLLYGDRGTGKSSTIKALVNRYAGQGLRLVELPKHQLPCFPQITGILRERARRFIVFIDDLSFEGHETEYKHLKAVLEGGVEAPPDNVLIYATSNRRHLVQENWSDRDGGAGEIHARDAMEEKLSLADRFGITVTFSAPDQEEYLRIVEGLAAAHNVDIPRDKLREMALKWERMYNVRSGRTARQFLNHLLGAGLEGDRRP